MLELQFTILVNANSPIYFFHAIFETNGMEYEVTKSVDFQEVGTGLWRHTEAKQIPLDFSGTIVLHDTYVDCKGKSMESNPILIFLLLGLIYSPIYPPVTVVFNNGTWIVEYANTKEEETLEASSSALLFSPLLICVGFLIWIKFTQ